MDSQDVIQWVVEEFFSPLYQLIVMITFLYFLWGVLRFIIVFRKGEDADAKKQGQNHMLFGLIGLFIVLSIGGFIKWIQNLVGTPFS